MKEEIIAIADGSDYLHGDLYETNFDTKYHNNVIFTQNISKGIYVYQSPQIKIA